MLSFVASQLKGEAREGSEHSDWLTVPSKHTILTPLLLFLAQTQTLFPNYPFIYTAISDIPLFEGSVMLHETS
jgi:hypothetical protein